MDLAFNNLQGLMCHKTKPNKPKPDAVEKYAIMSDDELLIAIIATLIMKICYCWLCH